MNITCIREFPDYSRPGFDIKKYINLYNTSNVITYASSSDVSYAKHNGTLSIKYAFKGDEYYATDKCRYRINNDNFMLFNLWQEYESYISSDEATESLSVFFHPAFAGSILKVKLMPEDRLLDNHITDKNNPQPVSFIEKLYPKDNLVVPILQNIRAAFNNNTASHGFLEEKLHFLVEALLYANRELYKDINRLQFVKPSTKIEIYKRLCIAKDYMDSCYNEKITLNSLAKSACMCEHHLLREFKKHFKITPHQYLTLTRLKRAAALLKTSEKTMSEISSAIGYEYLSSFSQLFYQRYGSSPSKFRIQQKSQF